MSYIISLGEDCFMRSLIDRYNIRDKFKIRMPFDGSIHPYEEMCRLIETDFIDYDKNIVFNHFFYGNNGLLFNHEKTTNIDNFKIQLNQRVEQFRRVLNEGKEILFLLHYKNKNVDFNASLLENALKKYPNLKYKLFIFNNYHHEYYIHKTPTTTYLNIFWNPNNITNFENLNYDAINNDFIRQMYVTPYGIEFSLQVVKEICSILNENVNKMDVNYNFNIV